MTPSAWPLHVIPRRSPPLWRAALISVAAVAGAILARGLLLGFHSATGLSASYFPAFIVATLYAGPRWGWATLIFAMVLGYLSPMALATQFSLPSLILLYGLSGAASIIVASALREALLQIDEAQASAAKVQSDLAATEARFRVLADSAPVLMGVARPDRQREFANRAYRDFLGVDEAGALTMDWRERLHPEDAVRDVAVAEPGVGLIWEARYRRADGEYRWIRNISQPRHSPDGDLQGSIGVGYDITESKQAQADLKR